MASFPPLRLILASASPARRDLLTRAGYAIEVIPAHIEEPTSAGYSEPRVYVEHVAWLKAQDVARRINSDSRKRPAVVLAADTVGWLGGQAIGKPADRSDARRILETLSGKEHELWTGVCLWRRPDDIQLAWQEMSRVVMRGMTPAEIETYLDSRQWEGCSGAYAIQEANDPHVYIVEGSMSNVIGLPMESLAQWLPRFAEWK
jgi:septum formation protein